MFLKIVQINTVFNGSTGKIMLSIAKTAKKCGAEVKCFAGYFNNNLQDDCFLIGNKYSPLLHSKLSYIFKNPEMNSYFETKKMLSKIDEFKPDIIHLHNLHGFYLNLPLLFKYIKKNNIKVIWTLHDCWSFTGRCPHYQIYKCDKWKIGCNKCEMPKIEYPSSLFDCTIKMWKRKKEWFNGINNMILVTPSKWLAEEVKKSYLSNYTIKIINNGIDLNIFKYRKSSFRNRYNLIDRKIILCVSFGWNYKKGLDTILDLSYIISNRYIIVLVGANEELDKKLPNNIISIHKTDNQIQLAEIYSAADVFFNPTREDTYPTVNMESIACGVPVITFDTGGSPEILNDRVGFVLKERDIKNVYKTIINICENQVIDRDYCIEFAKKFDNDICFKRYVELYKEVENDNSLN